MNSIPVGYMVGEESPERLSGLLNKYLLLPYSKDGVALRDILRQWAQEREMSFCRGSNASFSAIRDSPIPSSFAPERTESLTRLKYMLQISVDEVADGSVQMYYDALISGTVAAISAGLWAESESVKRKTIKYPADWWEALKLRFMGKWPQWIQCKIAPVKYHYETMDVKAVYPTFRAKLHDYPVRLIVEKRDGY